MIAMLGWFSEARSWLPVRNVRGVQGPCDRVRQHLDRDLPIQVCVGGAIHFAHPAAPRGANFIRAESGAEIRAKETTRGLYAREGCADGLLLSDGAGTSIVTRAPEVTTRLPVGKHLSGLGCRLGAVLLTWPRHGHASLLWPRLGGRPRKQPIRVDGLPEPCGSRSPPSRRVHRVRAARRPPCVPLALGADGSFASGGVGRGRRIVRLGLSADSCRERAPPRRWWHGLLGGFIEQYIVPLVYPTELTRNLQLVLGAIVVVVNVVVYILILRRQGDEPTGERRLLVHRRQSLPSWRSSG